MKCGFDLTFERAFIQVVCQAIESSQTLNHSRFAARVFPGDGDASATKWRRIRNQSKAGKPQDLKLDEAYRIAQILGLDLSSLVFQVEQRMKITAEQIIAPVKYSLPPA